MDLAEAGEVGEAEEEEEQKQAGGRRHCIVVGTADRCGGIW